MGVRKVFECWLASVVKKDGKESMLTTHAFSQTGVMYYLQEQRSKGYTIITWAIGETKRDAERLLSHKYTNHPKL